MGVYIGKEEAEQKEIKIVQNKRGKAWCLISGSKAGETEPSKPFDVRYRATELSVCSILKW